MIEETGVACRTQCRDELLAPREILAAMADEELAHAVPLTLTRYTDRVLLISSIVDRVATGKTDRWASHP